METKFSTKQFKDIAAFFESNPEIGMFFLETYGQFGPCGVERSYKDSHPASPLSARDVADFNYGIQALFELGFSEIQKPSLGKLIDHWDEMLQSSGLDARWFELKLGIHVIYAIAGMKQADHSLVIRTFTEDDYLDYNEF